MEFNFQTVSLSKIDGDEETYRITTSLDAEALAASIAKTGLINSPLLLQRESSLAIVCGFRRIAAARLLGWRELPARVLNPSISHLECAQRAIVDNTSQRQLNPIETSRALALLSTSFADEFMIPQAAGVLGLPNSLSLIKNLIPLCQLPREVQEGIMNTTISLPVAKMLSSLEPSVAIWFALLFESTKISLNKQREVITLSQEIALREDRSMTSVLADKPLRDILNNPDLDRSRKASALRSYLKHRRFPTLTRAKDAFEAVLKSLKLDSTTKLIPPADFEGREYCLNLTFKTLSELERHKKTIDRIAAHPDVRRLIDSIE